jgi:NAD(P)-dependent dehydrogenase (short-subunit alcohol dehydrogenase family)
LLGVGSVPRVQGKTVVVTGASSGIGAEAAVQLARLGGTVVPVGRNRGRLDAVSARIRDANPGGGGEPIAADFASLAAVRELAAELLERHPRIDVLVNNAGLVSGRRKLSEDGYELTFAVNHLAPFLLTNLLLERLRASAPARVVTTSSGVHFSGVLDLDDLNMERRWSTTSAYANSKLANVLFTRALAHRLESTGVVANCLHPGVIRTRLGRGASLPLRLGWRVVGLFFASPRKGAKTIVYLASAPEGAAVSGAYFVDSRARNPSAQAQDDVLAEELWERSERLTGLR